MMIYSNYYMLFTPDCKPYKLGEITHVEIGLKTQLDSGYDTGAVGCKVV